MEKINRIFVLLQLSLAMLLSLALLAGCGSSTPPTPTPLSASNLNLIFVASEDLSYHAAGDVNPGTANFTNQGLQRSLLMGSYLHEQVLGGSNVTSIYALEPMTHLQTVNNYPDMVALETIEQFAMLNQISLTSGSNPLYTGTVFRSTLPMRQDLCRTELRPRCSPARHVRDSTSTTRTATTKLC